MPSAEIVISIGAGVFMAILATNFTLTAISALFPARKAVLVKPFATPALLYTVALWKAPDMPYMAATIAVIATIQLSVLAVVVIAAFALTKWEEVLVEAVF